MTETTNVTQLTSALVNLSHHVLRLFAEVGRTQKLSQQQVELMCAVIVRGRVGMTELAKQLHLERSNVSNLLDRAEQRGLAIRTRDPDDRRVTWVELTERGNRVAVQIHGEVTRRLDNLINQLPMEDQLHLTAVVEQLMADSGE